MDDSERALFAEAAHDLNRPIALRGSTAEAYWDRRQQGSLVACAPPLGDLDLMVGNGSGVDRAAVARFVERLRTELPAYRFIHIDMLYVGTQGAADSALGNVRLKGLREVPLDGKNAEDPASEEATAEIAAKVPGVLFRDFLYLLRKHHRHPALRPALEEVVGLLTEQDPEQLGAATRRHGGGRELVRVEKALTKHVLLREEGTTAISDQLPVQWLFDFAKFLHPISQRILLGEATWLELGGVAYAVNGVVKELAVPAPTEERWAKIRNKLASQWGLDVGELTPMLEVELPEAPEPRCCEYRDFSAGISELAFTDVSKSPPLEVALVEGPDRVHLAQAQASCGCGASSLRSDPGYMSLLPGASGRKVRLFGARA